MKQLRNLSLILLFSGCAGTTFYGPNGKKTAHFQGDMSGVEYTAPGTTFKADQVIHSTATRAGGEAFARGVGAIGAATVQAGAAIAGSGLVKVAK